MFITQAFAATAATPGAAVNKVFPPFDSSTFASQLFWLAITFGALYYVLSKIALPRVTKILETRRARISGDLDAAIAAKKSADEAGAAYEKSLADAKATSQKNVQTLRDKLAAEADARRKTLEADLNSKLAAAEEKIGVMKVQAMSNVSAIAADAAAAIVRQISGRDADRKLIEDAVKG
ncbi:MAG: F0F1 ATP synthase subunit B' [Beijerinckiaceae bacterium]|nr:F0F1 ATP synthase subunit B' [Beijerinckiaceae bacterium]